MKLTVLGKYGPYPRPGNTATSGYLITQDNTKILLDMGSGILSRLTAVMDIKELDAIILSHLHFDHTSDLLPLRYLLEVINKKIDIYVHKENTAWYNVLFNHPLFNVINIDTEKAVKIGCFRLSFYEMKHTVPTFAIKVKGKKELYYTGDTLLNDNLLKSSASADYILADCSKPAEFKGPHMTIKDSLILRDNSSAKIFATHLNPEYVPDFSDKIYANIELTEENKTYQL